MSDDVINFYKSASEEEPIISEEVTPVEVKSEPIEISEDDPLQAVFQTLVENLQKTKASDFNKPDEETTDAPFAKFLGNVANIIKQDEKIQTDEQIKEATIDFINKIKDEDLKPVEVKKRRSSYVPAKLIKNYPKKKPSKLPVIEAEVEKKEEPVVEEVKEPTVRNAYVKELKTSDNKTRRAPAPSKPTDIKSIIEKKVREEIEKFSQHFAQVSMTAGGGGSVAVQYAKGGTMDGNLNVTGKYLSGGRDIATLFTGGGGGTPTNSLSANGYLLTLNDDGSVTFPDNTIRSEYDNPITIISESSNDVYYSGIALSPYAFYAYDNTGNSIYFNNTDNNIVLETLSANPWTFGNDGILTGPNSVLTIGGTISALGPILSGGVDIATLFSQGGSTSTYNPYTTGSNIGSIQPILGNNAEGGEYSAVLGGIDNGGDSPYSTIVGGLSNEMYSMYSGIGSFIGGGKLNSNHAPYSVIGGGERNITSGAYSFIAAGSANDTNNFDNTFILGSDITAVSANYTYVNNLSSQGTIFGQLDRLDNGTSQVILSSDNRLIFPNGTYSSYYNTFGGPGGTIDLRGGNGDVNSGGGGGYISLVGGGGGADAPGAGGGFIEMNGAGAGDGTAGGAGFIQANGAFHGGSAGYLKMNANYDTPAGFIDTSGGSTGVAIGGGIGGSIITRGCGYFAGGTIDTSANTLSGGSINTTNGGGDIITRGCCGVIGGCVNTSAGTFSSVYNTLGGSGGYIDLQGGPGGDGFSGGTGGCIIMRGSGSGGGNIGGNGGCIIMNGVENGNAGYINTSSGGYAGNGGSIDTRGYDDGLVGGNIVTCASSTGSGGYIYTYANSHGPGGSINTSDGGGNIFTKGCYTVSGGYIDTSAGSCINGLTNQAGRGGCLIVRGGSLVPERIEGSGIDNSGSGGSFIAIGGSNGGPGSTGGNAGSINISGGTPDIDANDSPAGNGGSICMIGGSGGIDDLNRHGNAGNIVTSGFGAWDGGSINTFAGILSGGSINTSNGGGNIDTTGGGHVCTGLNGSASYFILTDTDGVKWKVGVDTTGSFTNYGTA